MPLAGFEPTIPASERSQTYTLGRAAAGIGLLYSLPFRKYVRLNHGVSYWPPRTLFASPTFSTPHVAVLTRFHISAQTPAALTDIGGIFSALNKNRV